jgi:hypothetical protein
MRLGQLARKLAIRPSQIVDFLSTHQIYLEEGSNAKLYDEHVERIVQHFAPDRINEIAADIKVEEAAEKKEALFEVAELATNTENLKTENLEPESDLQQEGPEVIKAPKVELAGLKVLGKIELIEPKKKEKTVAAVGVEATKSETEERGRPDRRQVPLKPKRETQQSWKNPIALQREREAREAEERKKEAAEREKERRKEHYLKRVKVGQPTKPARIFDEPVEVHINQKQEVRPLGLWGRFMRWLNG